MTDKEKMTLLEEMFEADEGTLKPETELNSLENWDSMMKLSLIVLVDEECGKTLKSDDMKKFVTLRDIMDYMG